MDDSVTRTQLDVTVLGDVSREITYTTGTSDSRQRNVTMWKKTQSIAVHVHVEESSTGMLRLVKKVRPRSARAKDWRPEIQLMGRMSNETSLFVQFYGWFWSGQCVCIAMEYCPLGDLAVCFKDPLDEVVTWGLCSQLLQGLAKLHDMAITHRDIKPQNILVVEKDPLWIKIADFGISKQTLEGETDLRTLRAGTEGFMAPEILGLSNSARKDSKYTSAVDMWSLGCLLHYALTKESPFPKYQTLYDHFRGLSPYPEESLVCKGIGISARQFIKKLLVLEPADRPPASIDLMSGWIISETAYKSPFGTNSERKVSAGSDDDLDILSTEGWRNHVAGSPSPFASISRSAPTNNDASDAESMDYHTSELWHILRDTDLGPERIRPLLEQGANPNKLHKGLTALHLATTNGSIARINVLLEYGAKGSIRTNLYGETALHIATFDSDLDKIKLIIPHVDINAINSTGDTALHLLIARSCSLDAIKLLLAHGASANIRGRYGRTPLLYALSLNQQHVVEVLLEAGADPELSDNEGRNVLHHSIFSHKFTWKFIGGLIKAGAAVNQSDMKGRTPLHEAVQLGRRNVIRVLVDNGANTKLGDAGLERSLQRAMFWNGLSEKMPWRFGIV